MLHALPSPLPRHLLPFHPHCRSTSDQAPSSEIFFHFSLHTSLVMLRLAHVIQPRSSRPLLRPLDDLYPPHIGTVDFHPHLHPRHQEPIPQQNCSVHTLPSYAQTYTREWITGLKSCEEDVTRVGHVRIIAVEEAGAGTIRIEFGDVGGSVVGKWERVKLRGGWRGRIGLDFLGRCGKHED